MTNAVTRRVMIAVALLLPVAAAAEPIKLKMAYFASDREPPFLSVMQPFADAVNKQAKEKIDAFVCLEAQSGKEVASVLDSYHAKGKVVMAMDTDPDTLTWIQKDGIAATIAQKPYSMAYVGLEMLDTLYHHKPPALDADWQKDSFSPIPSFVDTGSALIDKANVGSFLDAKQSATGAK